jgi:cation:H+ antiporter
MMMLLNTIYLFGGLVLLYFGSDYLVAGSKNLALKFGIRPIVIGLTLVAFGTSAPELFVSLFSALKNPDNGLNGNFMAIGNIIGSNIANIALALGLAAAIKPINISRTVLFNDFPMMVLATVLFYIFSANGILSRAEGATLITLFIIYTSHLIITARNTKKQTNGTMPKKSKTFYLVITAGGMVGILSGAQLMILGGVGWAKFFGISDVVVGLTIFAIGTSLPEVATSVVAIIKGEDDISIGNIIGSNVQNVALVVAIVAIVTPLSIPKVSLTIDFPILIVTTAILGLLFWFSKQVSRIQGISLLTGYFIYIFHLYTRQ